LTKGLETLQARDYTKSEESLQSFKLQKCLAATFRDQGSFSVEESQLSHTLCHQISVLGSDHPEVLKTKHAIAVGLKTQGLLERAIESLSECCELSAKVLGSSNWETRYRQRTLKAWENKTGEDNEIGPEEGTSSDTLEDVVCLQQRVELLAEVEDLRKRVQSAYATKID
jgi:hypothetical protein